MRHPIGSLNEVISRLDGIPQTAARALYQKAETTMTISKKVVNVKTGTLRSTGHVRSPVIAGNKITVTMGYGGPAAPYAKLVHDGWGPREVVPKNKKALYWPGARHPVKRVRHPGYKGNPYLVKPVEESLDGIVEHVMNSLADHLKGT